VMRMVRLVLFIFWFIGIAYAVDRVWPRSFAGGCQVHRL